MKEKRDQAPEEKEEQGRNSTYIKSSYATTKR